MGRHAAGRNAGEGQPSPGGEERREPGGPTGEWTLGPNTRTFAELSPESLAAQESLASHGRPGPDGLGSDGDRRGFLGSGWNDRQEPPRRRRRLALVSGLSVLLAVGVTAGGARLIAGHTTLTMEPPASACASAGRCVAAPADAGGGAASLPTSGAGDGTPDEGRDEQAQNEQAQNEPTQNEQPQDESAQGEPTQGEPTQGEPTDGASAQPTSAQPTTTASPKRERTRARTSASPKPVASKSAPSTTTKDTSGTSTEAPSDSGDAGTGGSAQPDGSATGSDGDAPTQEGEVPGNEALAADDASAPGAAAVGVAYTVTSRGGHGYTARLAVRNEGAALDSWTLRLPVRGQVVSVEGAGWEQQGGTLIVRSGGPLAEGEEVSVVFDAEGSPRTPASCTLDEGSCVVTGGPARRGRA